MRKLYSQLLLLFLSAVCVAQVRKLSVIGSSTAAGTGTTVSDSSWVNRTTYYYNSIGFTTITTNLAIPGKNCYQGMPSTYVPPPSRDYPDPSSDITLALTFNPEVVIVNSKALAAAHNSYP